MFMGNYAYLHLPPELPYTACQALVAAAFGEHLVPDEALDAAESLEQCTDVPLFTLGIRNNHDLDGMGYVWEGGMKIWPGFTGRAGRPAHTISTKENTFDSPTCRAVLARFSAIADAVGGFVTWEGRMVHDVAPPPCLPRNEHGFLRDPVRWMPRFVEILKQLRATFPETPLRAWTATT